MPKGGDNFSVADDEGSGHLSDIGTGDTHQMSFEQGLQPAPPDGRASDPAQRSAGQPKGLVQALPGVADAGQIAQPVLGRQRTGDLLLIEEHEQQACPGGLQGGTGRGEIGQRLSTERTSRMAEEQHQQGGLLAPLPGGLPELVAVLGEQLGE